ncbi:MAG: PHP domain-containing protein, partial [Limnobacter sp.]|nr:PHP domain-containing protein [Limnobacter sp.]
MTQPDSTSFSPFVHLRLHTEYSVTDGLVRVGEAVSAAKTNAMPALAMTDLSNLFGLVKFYRKCRSQGIKPIAAVDTWIESVRGEDQPARAILLVMNHKGYLQLCEILSRAFLRNQVRGKAIVKYEWFDEVGCDGLIALSGFQNSDLGQALLMGKQDQAVQATQKWLNYFEGRFYLELQRDGTAQADNLTNLTCQLAHQMSLPVVATHPIQ